MTAPLIRAADPSPTCRQEKQIKSFCRQQLAASSGGEHCCRRQEQVENGVRDALVALTQTAAQRFLGDL